MLDAEQFVFLSELGLSVDQIAAHFRTARVSIETIAQDNWQCSAEEASKRLHAAGPVALIARAGEMAERGNEKMILYLLEKLWKPTTPDAAAPPANLQDLTNDQLTRIHRIMTEGGM